MSGEEGEQRGGAKGSGQSRGPWAAGARASIPKGPGPPQRGSQLHAPHDLRVPRSPPTAPTVLQAAGLTWSGRGCQDPVTGPEEEAGDPGGDPARAPSASRGPGLALSADPGQPCPSRRVRAPRGAWSMTHGWCGRSLPGVTWASHLPLGVDVSELALNLRTDVAGLCCPFWVSLPRGWMYEPPAPREHRWGVHPPCFSRVFYLVTMPLSTHGLLTVGAGRLWSGSVVSGGQSPCPCQVSSTKSA